MRHLHLHTTFSFLDGYGTPKQVAARVRELGHDACAVTDHGNVFAHVPWSQAARDAGVQPIYGCEFYVVDDASSKERVLDLGASSFPHVTVLAASQRGYANLLALSRRSYTEGFYYRPRTSWSELARYQEGLVVLSGCPGGYPTRLLLSRGADAMLEFLSARARELERFYVEIVPEPGLDKSHAAAPWLLHAALTLNLPYVFTADAHFPRAEDHHVQDLMLAVGMHERVDSPQRKLRLPEYQFCCSEDELRVRARAVLPDVDETYLQRGLDASDEIAASCVGVELRRAPALSVPFLAEGESAADRLWTLIARGAVERGVAHDARYLNRARFEFEVLRDKGFCDYVLVVIELIQWARDQGALVVTRGSAGGCLILWLTKASVTNPIEHGLSFERFYDHTRSDPPDVDIDFESRFRAMAISHVAEVYGRDRCAQLAALSKVQAKAALQDACFALGVPRSEYAPLSAALDSRDDDVEAQLRDVTAPEALAVLERHPELRIIEQMIGQYRQQSVHAAGVLISSEPIADVVGVVLGKDKQPIAAIDKKGAASLGFLKADLLSVDALDVVADAVRALGVSDVTSWLEAVPLNDQAALSVARAGALAGVFQLAGGSAGRVCKQIGVERFDDVPIAGALCRPGPGEWVETYRAHQLDPSALTAYLASLHPTAARIVAPTRGVLLYQEQVMALARELAGLDWKDVHRLRKDVQDKVGLDPQEGPKWEAEWSEKFVNGCTAQGVARDEAIFWWRSLKSHGGYSFNKAHCYTYGLVGYWMLYLKAHHTREVYASYLQHETDPAKLKRLVREYQQLGGHVGLLDPRSARATFAVGDDGVLYGGWTDLKGIGPATAQKMQGLSPFAGWDDLLQRAPKGVAAKLAALRHPNGAWRTQRVLALAPWFPVSRTDDDEAALQAQFFLGSLNCLTAGKRSDGDVQLSGYVTATDFERDRVRFILEDEHAAVPCFVAARHLHVISERVRKLKVADYVAVSAWWSGDSLVVRDASVLKEGTSVEQ